MSKKTFHERLTEITCENRHAFRAWLDAHHDTEPGVWLVYYKVKSDTPSIRWEGAVREALCYGWIDSRQQSLDDERYRQVFSPRKRGSVWSAVNKRYIEELEEEGLMMDAGRAKIDAAKEDGSWTLLDDVEALVVPEELRDALKAAGGRIEERFDALAKSTKKQALYKLFLAKREATRAKRIAEIVDSLRA